MASSGGSYGANVYSSSRSNSQAHLWGDGTQAVPNAGASGYLGNIPDPSAYETTLASSGSVSRQGMIPYQINTNNLTANPNNDRVLPTPGSRNYSSSSFTGTSTVENLPLSALSHRSSIGWSTDSASSASHISSQTSATGSSIGQEYSGERSSIHRVSDSQDLSYNGLGFSYSSQQPGLASGALPINNENVSHTATYGLSKNNALHSLDLADSSNGAAQDSPSHHHRCRTISQSSTPVVSQMSASAGGSSMGQLHRHHGGRIASRSHEVNIGEVADPSTSAAALNSGITSHYAAISTTTPFDTSTSTDSSTSQPCNVSSTHTSSSIPSSTPYSISATAPSSTMTPSISGLYGYTTPPVTQAQQRGAPPGGSASSAVPSSLRDINSGAAQSQTRSHGAAAASGNADSTATSGTSSSGGGSGGGISAAAAAGLVLGYSELARLEKHTGHADGLRQGHSSHAREYHSGVLAAAAAAAAGRGVGVGVGVSAGAAGSDDYASQVGGDVAGAVGSVARSSVSSAGYGLSQ
jgi:trimeric autotransporter adhesin